MTPHTSPTVKHLDRAQRKAHFVRLGRSTRFGGDVEGIVVAVGKKWTLLGRCEDGGYPGGWIATRLEHVDQVHRVRTFEETFARSLPSWPPTAPAGVDLDTTAGLVATLQANASLIAIEQEDRVADCTWVGRVENIADGRLWLHEVDHLAQWHHSSSSYRLRNITTVSTATPYLLALQTVLGQLGTPSPPTPTVGPQP